MIAVAVAVIAGVMAVTCGIVADSNHSDTLTFLGVMVKTTAAQIFLSGAICTWALFAALWLLSVGVRRSRQRTIELRALRAGYRFSFDEENDAAVGIDPGDEDFARPAAAEAAAAVRTRTRTRTRIRTHADARAGAAYAGARVRSVARVGTGPGSALPMAPQIPAAPPVPAPLVPGAPPVPGGPGRQMDAAGPALSDDEPTLTEDAFALDGLDLREPPNGSQRGNRRHH